MPMPAAEQAEGRSLADSGPMDSGGVLNSEAAWNTAMVVPDLRSEREGRLNGRGTAPRQWAWRRRPMKNGRQQGEDVRPAGTPRKIFNKQDGRSHRHRRTCDSPNEPRARSPNTMISPMRE